MSSNDRPLMDGETAMAFAGHAFSQRHPRNTCPEWLARCTSIGYSKDDSGRFVVSFCVTPKATNDAVVFFEVAVDRLTAATEILVDRPVTEFSGEQLQGFSAMLAVKGMN